MGQTPQSSNGHNLEAEEMGGLPEKFKKIPLVECFGPTIQGEGLSIGQPTYFLRFGLCDYKCTMCDSMHAVDPQQVRVGAEWITQKEIFTKLLAISNIYPNSTKWVTFTGGNPLVHDLEHLMRLLYRNQWKVNVETQGTLFKPWIKDADIITISPKGPSMWDKFDIGELALFIQLLDRSIDKAYFKFVVFDEKDLEFVSYVANTFQIHPGRITLSQGNRNVIGEPGMNLMWERLHKEYLEMFEILRTYPGLAQCKYLPQWHVWIWGNMRGV